MAATPEALRLPAGASGPPAALYGKLSPGPGKSAAEVAAHQRARIHSAMVEAVAESGYGSVTVREIARLAGVSSKAFYKSFESKEECFFRTYELIVRRAARRIVAAQAGERDWRERLRLGFTAFARELDREPGAARLALIEAYVLGPEGQEYTRHTESMYEAMIAESFSRAPDDVEMPPLVVEGIVAGAIRIARMRLVEGEDFGEPDLGAALTEWALSYGSEAVKVLSALDRQARLERVHSTPLMHTQVEGSSANRADDRGLLLSAAMKLVASDGYDSLTIASITNAAGLPRRSFKAHFPTVEECYLAAVNQRAREVLEQALDGPTADCLGERGVYQAVAAITGWVAADTAFERLCFADAHAAGPRGLIRRSAFPGLISRELDERDASRPLWAEASAGAIWGVVHHQVVVDRSHRAPDVAATLAFLALAPERGAEAATAAIEAEQEPLCAGVEPSDRKRKVGKLD